MMDATMPDISEPYGVIAEFYDLEHAGFREDVDLFLSFADIVGGPILEMGCGSGRVLVPLAQAGHDVTGVDRSPAMLKRAAAAALESAVADRITLSERDIADAQHAPGGPFGLVIFSLNALMHLPTSQAQIRALQAAFAAMDPKGQLIIDTLNPSPQHLTELEDGLILEGSWTQPDGTTIDKWSLRRIHPANQLIETTFWYDQISPDGRLQRTRSQLSLRYVHATELELMLQLAGFCETKLYGSYDLDPYDDESDRLFLTSEVTPSSASSRLGSRDGDTRSVPP